ncbi:MFS transporter [Sorangium sp. So ce1389]|uniref:MFS transporter n=1 Tax=Sorangium sp. So ce1389 TaxID=3133336 RepID=UPI003F62A096
MNERVRPLKQWPFRLFVAGRAVSMVGDVVSRVAVPLLILDQAGSGIALGVVGVLQTAPSFFFGLVAGALADRLEKRITMFAADVGSALLTALIPLSHVLGFDVFTVTMAVALPLGMLRVLYTGAYTAAIPEIVGRDDLPRAMGLLQIIEAAAHVVGPALVGLLVSRLGAASTLAVDAGSFLVSAAALCALPRLPGALSGARKSLGREVAEGVRFVARHRLLRAMILLWGAVTVATAGIIPVMMFWVSKDLHVDMRWVGLAMSIFAAGSILGAFTVARVPKERLGAVLLVGVVFYGAVLIAVSGASGSSNGRMLLLALLAVAGGAAFGSMTVSYYTLLPLATPRELVGRVGSTAKTVTQAFQSLGMVATGAVLEVLRGAGSLRVMGATMILAGLLSALPSSIRRLDGGLFLEPRK